MKKLMSRLVRIGKRAVVASGVPARTRAMTSPSAPTSQPGAPRAVSAASTASGGASR